VTRFKKIVCIPRFRYGLRVALGFLLAGAIANAPAAFGQVAKTPAEKFVLEHLKIKGEADLEESPLKENERVLRHEFLEEFITSTHPNAAIVAYGINISNVTVHGQLNVNNATIAFPLRFAKCKFEGGIDFSYDKFAHDLSLDHSVIGIKDMNANTSSALFLGMKVEDALNLHGTYFYSTVNFTYAEIGSELLSDEVHYESPEDADFDSLKAKAPVFFRKCHFAGKLNLSDGDLFSLQLEGSLPLGQNSSDPLGNIDLEINQAQIRHGFEVKNVALSRLQAGFVDMEGPTDLENVVPVGHVDLNHSHFQDLTITGFDQWLQRGVKTRDFRLEGLTFDGIELPQYQVEPSAIRMLALIDSSPYSPQPYLELERYLRAHGNPDEADDVYIDMRRRGRAQLYFLQRPFDLMLDLLVGYGRRPWRSGLAALLLILVGALIFRRQCMEHDDEKCSDEWYNPFWFSLDLLSPIDLGVSKRWRAKDYRLRNYAQVHRVAGWILIPLIAAAITGIIK